MNRLSSLQPHRRARRLPLTAALLLFGTLGLAHAAQPPPAPSLASIQPLDSMQQRIAACVACHGVHGEGSPDDLAGPRLAGKPAAYLALQLQGFQNGQRKNAYMEYIVRNLDREYMQEIADYFSRQEIPYRPTPTPSLSPQALRRAEQLVNRGDLSRGIPSCTSCHGSELNGIGPWIPGLRGLSYDYTAEQLKSWRAGIRGARKNDCMAVVAGRLQESDIAAVAAWLTSRQPAASESTEATAASVPILPGWCRLDTTTARR